MKRPLGMLKLSPKPGFFARGAFSSDVDRSDRAIGIGGRHLHFAYEVVSHVKAIGDNGITGAMPMIVTV